MFDWEAREQQNIVAHSCKFRGTDKRSYLTASGTAPKRTADPTFLAKAAASQN